MVLKQWLLDVFLYKGLTRFACTWFDAKDLISAELVVKAGNEVWLMSSQTCKNVPKKYSSMQQAQRRNGLPTACRDSNSTR